MSDYKPLFKPAQYLNLFNASIWAGGRYDHIRVGVRLRERYGCSIEAYTKIVDDLIGCAPNRTDYLNEEVHSQFSCPRSGRIIMRHNRGIKKEH